MILATTQVPPNDCKRPSERALRLTVAVAGRTARQQIYRLRHAVYARELRQYPENDAGRLSDAIDAHNIYIVARHRGAVIGFVSITPPQSGQFSIDKYLPRQVFPFPINHLVYEVRLLTVAQPYRGSPASGLLMYAALRWIEARGGRHIVAIGRREVMGLYRRVGLQPLGITVRCGAVTFEAMHATTNVLHEHLRALQSLLRRTVAKVDWQLDVPLEKPATCYHGGAFFDAIGNTFDTLNRNRYIINADVLDAWFDPSPKVIEALQTYLPWLLRTSPPTGCEGMVQKIAQMRAVDPASVLPGAGSSDLIYLALRHWLSRRSRVLILDPTYGEYTHVLEQRIQCKVDRLILRRDNDYSVDPLRLRAQLRHGYDLVVLVNPNSPTGRHVPRQVLQTVVADGPSRTRFWIDETYVDYIGADQSLERFAATSSNIVVCKSMSKVYALSGARAAYLCGPPSLITELRSLNPPWAVSLPGQVAAVHALQDPDYYARMYDQTHVLRRQLARQLSEVCGLYVVPSVANFLLCHLPDDGIDAATLVDRCHRHRLFIRDVSNMGSQFGRHDVRIAVKDAETNHRVIKILAHVLKR